MSIDKYFGRRYNIVTYNCAHLVVDVWSDLFGPRIAEMLQGYLCAPSKRRSKISELRKGRWLDKCEDPCIVLMQAPKQSTHVGVFVRGKVLHISQGRGVQYQPLHVASFGFQRIRFFTCR